MKKRILLLVKGLNRGGMEQLLVSRAAYLDTSRFQYEIAYLLSWADQLVHRLDELGIPAHCLDADRRSGWMSRLRAFARKRQVDLIHVHSPYAAIGARIVFPRRLHPPLVCTEHTVWEGLRRPTYWANAMTFPRNDHVFAVSDHVMDSIRYPRPLRGRPIPPIERVYQGIDPAAVRQAASANGARSELGIPEDALVVGCVANFTLQKAHGHLLMAIDQVRRSIPEVKLVLVGEGPLEKKVRSQTHRLGLEDVVIFTGGRRDVPRIAEAFDVFALSSVQEGLSIALLEAMALGKPAVVTGAGGLPEVVEHERQGLVVPPADSGALADSICAILREKTVRLEMGREARRRADKFHVSKAVRRTEEVYGELLRC